MTRLCLTLAALAALALPVQAQHHGGGAPGPDAGNWSGSPQLQVIPDRQDRSRARLRLVNLEATQVTVFPPQGEPYPLPVADGQASLAPGAVGNYHWLQAREETGAGVTVATAVRYFSAPGPAPTALLERPLSELEIVPQPLPREHWQYRSGQTWAFLVRFQGRPLPQATLHFTSRNGSHRMLETDAQGLARLSFPDDWPKAPGEGRSNRRTSAPFVLEVLHQDDGRQFRTTFSGGYGPDPMATRNLAAGLGFMALGGVLALPLLKRRARTGKEKPSC